MNSRRSSRSADLERRAGPPRSAGARRGHGRGQKSFWGVDYYKPVTVPSSLVPWPALGRSAPRGGAVKKPYGFSVVDFGQKAPCGLHLGVGRSPSEPLGVWQLVD